jgi:quinol monooxygenase YgiN
MRLRPADPVVTGWDSAEHHAASLQLPETRAVIAATTPLLIGEFTSQSQKSEVDST